MFRTTNKQTQKSSDNGEGQYWVGKIKLKYCSKDHCLKQMKKQLKYK